MRVKDLRVDFISVLSEIYDDVEEVHSFFYILSEKFLGLKRVDVAISLDMIVPAEVIHDFVQAQKLLQSHVPIQYVVGDTEFYGLPFIVNPAVLIPRPETEELVDWIIKDYHTSRTGGLFKKEPLKILDIGTGSGCIAISLAKHLQNAQIFAMDISEKAIEVAKANAKLNNVDIRFVLSDILNSDTLPDDFDIIVSNPPYVRDLEKKEIQPNVLDHEPHLALFVSDTDPLIFYKKIAELAKDNLIANGILYFEINQYLGSDTQLMMEHKGFESVQLRKDFYANDRMMRATKRTI
ncbi:peptide chain release factor N(5)-glutamine methyltransferase [Aquimarina addita]|uniref:Release factor glutamine methyltransferase n=1 Tax=Aquimarina addita TaxID=870485 RepID=A0ABP6USV3_9FLAO